MFHLLIFSLLLVYCQSLTDKYHEKLLIKPLQSGNVYTAFQFTVEKETGDDYDSSFHHYHLFPRSLGETLYRYQVQELHFSLTYGLWRYEKWGYPQRSAPPGAEIWAHFKGNVSEVSSNWKKLTNILSGQFCASLNFIDETNTAMPKFSFRPEGTLPSNLLYNSSFVRYSSLPPEIICTENLTPFRKLLPCSSMAGLSTLLNALNIFNAPFVSLAVDIQTVCKDKSCSSVNVQLIQTFSVVFDSPILTLSKQDWSFVKLFGSVLHGTCPLASTSKVYVDISSNKTGIHFSLNPDAYTIAREKLGNPDDPHSTEETAFAVFDLKEVLQNRSHVNIGAAYEALHLYGIIPPPLFHVDRKITGYGQENGGIHCTFYNNHPEKSLKIIYFDLVPWYLRLYSHTLIIKEKQKVITPDHYYYQPAKDRQQPHHLEVALTLPPKSATELNIEFDFAFLKWTEYPPDANHGFYVGSAVVSTVLDTNRNFSRFPLSDNNFRHSSNFFLRLYTQILLVSLPTPDFSMPYNVICLTCTVVALAFGPIHNITTKSLCPLDETDNQSFITKLKSKVKKWWKGDEEESKTNKVKTDEVETDELKTDDKCEESCKATDTD